MSAVRRVPIDEQAARLANFLPTAIAFDLFSQAFQRCAVPFAQANRDAAVSFMTFAEACEYLRTTHGVLNFEELDPHE